MKDTLKDFYPCLVSVPEIVGLVTTAFPDDAAAILQGMKVGTDLGEMDDELEDLLTEFITDHAEEVTSYKGLGGSDNSPREAIIYFEDHHPEAAELIKAQSAELEKLLGKGGAAAALGQSREPFAIRVLQFKFLYIVTADEFEDEFFDEADGAIEFAKSNYAPFIKNFEMNGR